MLNVRKSEDRGNADHGWLKSRHTFSFADYHDPKFMGFRSLRVINEDRIDGGTGFGKHGHRDMEIISYVVDGALAHKDSMGNEAIILPGEVQRLTAGTGITHSEHNYKPKDVTHFFQIWIVPKKNGVQPGYGQKNFEKDLNSKNLVLVVSEDGRDGSIKINQDADVYISRLKENEKLKNQSADQNKEIENLHKSVAQLQTSFIEQQKLVAQSLQKMEALTIKQTIKESIALK